jgi:hypothetical protein
MARRQQRKHTRSDLIASLKGSGVRGPLSKMTKAQLQKMHADRTEVATDQQQTLGVMSGSASTNLPLGGSGSSSGISLEGGRGSIFAHRQGRKATIGSILGDIGRDFVHKAQHTQVSGSGHCSGGGKQGSGTFQQLVKKHKGDMKAASREYKQQKGSGSVHPARQMKDLFGLGQPLAVEQFLDEGASDEQDGSGKASDMLSKLSKGAALGGLALAPTGVGTLATPFLEGFAAATGVGSKVADLFGKGQPLAVEQFLDDDGILSPGE